MRIQTIFAFFNYVGFLLLGGYAAGAYFYLSSSDNLTQRLKRCGVLCLTTPLLLLFLGALMMAFIDIWFKPGCGFVE